MRSRDPSPSLGRSRSGYIVVKFALLDLPMLLGMLGLVIDCGLLWAAHRATQSAADAAAMAAAMAKLSGSRDPQTEATTIVTQWTYNGLSNATLTAFNNPPTEGPHAGNSNYYEVVVSYPVTTLFMPALGVNPNHSVQARAVAGFETVLDSFPVVGGGSSFPVGEVIGALDPTASPGLEVKDSAGLVVNGRIIVNSPASPAATVSGGQIQAAVYNIVGPAVSGTFSPYPGASHIGPLLLNQPPMPDPLINLPTPATNASTANHTATPPGTAWSTQEMGSQVVDRYGVVIDNGVMVDNGVVNNGNPSSLQSPNSFDLTTNTVQLNPGVYQSIQITGGTVTVNFNPGVYILRPSIGTSVPSLVLAGGTITGNGVMFYNTGADFEPSTGLPDNNDASQYNPGPSGINAPAPNPGNFAGIQIDSSQANSISLSGLSDDNDAFKGVVLYQRRANTQTINITSGGNLTLLTGTLYAKWAQFNITGGGTYQAQFIGGSMQVQPDPLSGPATLTLNWNIPPLPPLRTFGRANEVFIVE